MANYKLTPEQKEEANAVLKQMREAGKSDEEIIAYKKQYLADSKAANDAAKGQGPGSQTGASAGQDGGSASGTGTSDSPEKTWADYAQTAGKNPASPDGRRYDDDGEVINLADDFGSVGELVESIPFVGDLIDDLYGAVKQGRAQARVVDDALGLFAEGKDVDAADLEEYMARVAELENQPVSQEMKDFNQAFEDAGGGAWGFISAIAQNPSVAATTMVSSLVAMANPSSLKGAAAGGAAGAGVGFSFAGIGAIPGAVAGAMAGASGVLDTAMSFNEFLQEEMAHKGLKFNRENVQATLADKEALSRIRTRSAARGAVVGLIDGITGGIAAKAVKGISTAAKGLKYGGALSGAAGLAIEGAGGGVGESLARVAAGQEQDAKEIGLEIVGEFGGGAAVVATAAREARGQYQIGDEKNFTRSEMQTFLESATPEEAAAANIKNDKELSSILREKITDKKSINQFNELIDETELEPINDKIGKIQSLLVKKLRAPKEQQSAYTETIKRLRGEVMEQYKEATSFVSGLDADQRNLYVNNINKVKKYNEQLQSIEDESVKADLQTKIDTISSENSAIKAQGFEKAEAKRASAKKAKQAEVAEQVEVEEQEAIQEEAEQLGVAPEQIAAQRDEKQAHIDDDVKSNESVIENVTQTLRGLGMNLVGETGTVPANFADTNVPMSQDGPVFTKGDFNKRIDPLNMEQNNSPADILNLVDDLKKLKKQGKIDYNVSISPDGKMLSGNVFSPKREKSLDEQYPIQEAGSTGFDTRPEPIVDKDGTVIATTEQQEAAARGVRPVSPEQAVSEAASYAKSTLPKHGRRAYEGDAPVSSEGGGVHYPGLTSTFSGDLKEAGVYPMLAKYKRSGYPDVSYTQDESGLTIVPGKYQSDKATDEFKVDSKGRYHDGKGKYITGPSEGQLNLQKQAAKVGSGPQKSKKTYTRKKKHKGKDEFSIKPVNKQATRGAVGRKTPMADQERRINNSLSSGENTRSIIRDINTNPELDPIQKQILIDLVNDIRGTEATTDEFSVASDKPVNFYNGGMTETELINRQGEQFNTKEEVIAADQKATEIIDGLLGEGFRENNPHLDIYRLFGSVSSHGPLSLNGMDVMISNFIQHGFIRKGDVATAESVARKLIADRGQNPDKVMSQFVDSEAGTKAVSIASGIEYTGPYNGGYRGYRTETSKDLFGSLIDNSPVMSYVTDSLKDGVSLEDINKGLAVFLKEVNPLNKPFDMYGMSKEELSVRSEEVKELAAKALEEEITKAKNSIKKYEDKYEGFDFDGLDVNNPKNYKTVDGQRIISPTYRDSILESQSDISTYTSKLHDLAKLEKPEALKTYQDAFLEGKYGGGKFNIPWVKLKENKLQKNLKRLVIPFEYLAEDEVYSLNSERGAFYNYDTEEEISVNRHQPVKNFNEEYDGDVEGFDSYDDYLEDRDGKDFYDLADYYESHEMEYFETKEGSVLEDWPEGWEYEFTNGTWYDSFDNFEALKNQREGEVTTIEALQEIERAELEEYRREQERIAKVGELKKAQIEAKKTAYDTEIQEEVFLELEGLKKIRAIHPDVYNAQDVINLYRDIATKALDKKAEELNMTRNELMEISEYFDSLWPDMIADAKVELEKQIGLTNVDDIVLDLHMASNIAMETVREDMNNMDPFDAYQNFINKSGYVLNGEQRSRYAAGSKKSIAQGAIDLALSQNPNIPFNILTQDMRNELGRDWVERIDKETGTGTLAWDVQGDDFSIGDSPITNQQQHLTKNDIDAQLRKKKKGKRYNDLSSMELNIGLENNPKDLDGIINDLRKLPNIYLETTEQVTGEYDGQPERTLVVQARFDGDGKKAKALVQKMTEDYTQEAIPVRLNNTKGALVWNKGYEGDKYAFDAQYFENPSPAPEATRSPMSRNYGAIGTEGSLRRARQAFNNEGTGSRPARGTQQNVESPLKTMIRRRKQIIKQLNIGATKLPSREIEGGISRGTTFNNPELRAELDQIDAELRRIEDEGRAKKKGEYTSSPGTAQEGPVQGPESPADANKGYPGSKGAQSRSYPYRGQDPAEIRKLGGRIDHDRGLVIIPGVNTPFKTREDVNLGPYKADRIIEGVNIDNVQEAFGYEPKDQAEVDRVKKTVRAGARRSTAIKPAANVNGLKEVVEAFNSVQALLRAANGFRGDSPVSRLHREINDVYKTLQPIANLNTRLSEINNDIKNLESKNNNSENLDSLYSEKIDLEGQISDQVESLKATYGRAADDTYSGALQNFLETSIPDQVQGLIQTGYVRDHEGGLPGYTGSEQSFLRDLGPQSPFTQSQIENNEPVGDMSKDELTRKLSSPGWTSGLIPAFDRELNKDTSVSREDMQQTARLGVALAVDEFFRGGKKGGIADLLNLTRAKAKEEFDALSAKGNTIGISKQAQKDYAAIQQAEERLLTKDGVQPSTSEVVNEINRARQANARTEKFRAISADRVEQVKRDVEASKGAISDTINDDGGSEFRDASVIDSTVASGPVGRTNINLGRKIFSKDVYNRLSRKIGGILAKRPEGKSFDTRADRDISKLDAINNKLDLEARKAAMAAIEGERLTKIIGPKELSKILSNNIDRFGDRVQLLGLDPSKLTPQGVYDRFFGPKKGRINPDTGKVDAQAQRLLRNIIADAIVGEIEAKTADKPQRLMRGKKPTTLDEFSLDVGRNPNHMTQGGDVIGLKNMSNEAAFKLMDNWINQYGDQMRLDNFREFFTGRNPDKKESMKNAIAKNHPEFDVIDHPNDAGAIMLTRYGQDPFELTLDQPNAKKRSINVDARDFTHRIKSHRDNKYHGFDEAKFDAFIKKAKARITKQSGTWGQIDGTTSRHGYDSGFPDADSIKIERVLRNNRLSHEPHADGSIRFKPGKRKRVGEFSIGEESGDKGFINEAIDWLKANNPDTEFITDREAIKPILERNNLPLSYWNKVFGVFTREGNIVLNPENISEDTAFHEVGHGYLKKLKKLAPALYRRMEGLAKKSKTYQKLKDHSVYGKYNEARLLEEVMAHDIGLAGAKIFKARKDATLWDQFRQKAYDFVAKSLGMSKKDFMGLKYEDLIEGAAADIATAGGKQYTLGSKQDEFSVNDDTSSDPDVSAAYLRGKQNEGKWYTKPFKWLIPPAADDYHGLVSQLNIPGIKRVTDAFINDHHAHIEKVTQAREDIQAIKDKLGVSLSEKDVAEIGGAKLTAAQAIQAHVNGKPTDFTRQANVQEYINDMQDMGVLTKKTTYHDASPDADIYDYLNTTMYRDSFKNFNKVKSEVFDAPGVKEKILEKGPKYAKALELALLRMSSGKNSGNSTDATTQKWNDWALGSVGTIMFLNFRSAALQMMSVMNYGLETGNPGGFVASFFSPDTWAEAKKLYGSGYLTERRKRAGFDVNTQEMMDYVNNSKSFGEFTKRVLNKGFIATSAVDSMAIAMGGAAFIKAQQQSGVSRSEAIKQWKEKTEEAQQSARPDRVSQWQTEGISKFILAFANTPQQYFRLSQKAFRDIKKGKNVKQNMAKIGYYMVVQNAMFNMAQAASLALLGLDPEDEDGEKAKSALSSMSGTILRGMGLYGAVIDAGKNVIMQAIKEEGKARPDHVNSVLKATSISPPLNRKIQDLLSIGRAHKYGADDKWTTTAAKGITATTNLPTDWAQKKYNAAKNLWDDQFTSWQKLLMLAGWSEWNFKDSKKNKNQGFSFDNEGFSFDEGGFEFDEDDKGFEFE